MSLSTTKLNNNYIHRAVSEILDGKYDFLLSTNFTAFKIKEGRWFLNLNIFLSDDEICV
jgi:hypothetical protein